MCVVALAWQVDPAFPLVLIANRDEFFERPSAPLGAWDDGQGIVAGRDLRGGGTWLGMHPESGRVAVVTNVREPGVEPPDNALSRGELVTGFLCSGSSAAEYAQQVSTDGGRYAGFNVLLCDGDSLWYSSNRAQACALSTGVHGLSNAGLNTPWPKLERITAQLQQTLQSNYTLQSLDDVLSDDAVAADKDLPDTGVGLDWERYLSSIYIDGKTSYGTRARTVVAVGRDGRMHAIEYSRHAADGGWSQSEFKS